jgi:hypothetical protein
MCLISFLYKLIRKLEGPRQPTADELQLGIGFLQWLIDKGHGHWITNTHRDDLDKFSMVPWVVGEPKQTEACTSEQLKAWGMVGLYWKRGKRNEL